MDTRLAILAATFTLFLLALVYFVTALFRTVKPEPDSLASVDEANWPMLKPAPPDVVEAARADAFAEPTTGMAAVLSQPLRTGTWRPTEAEPASSGLATRPSADYWDNLIEQQSGLVARRRVVPEAGTPSTIDTLSAEEPSDWLDTLIEELDESSIERPAPTPQPAPPAPGPVVPVPMPQPAPPAPEPVVPVPMPQPAPPAPEPVVPVPTPQPAPPAPEPVVPVPTPQPAPPAPEPVVPVPTPQPAPPAPEPVVPVPTPQPAPPAPEPVVPVPTPQPAPPAPEPVVPVPTPQPAPPAPEPVAEPRPQTVVRAVEPIREPVRAQVEGLTPVTPERPRTVVASAPVSERPAASVTSTQSAPDAPELTLVAPVEMWFGDSRVGVKAGSRTYELFQKYANVLFDDLQRAKIGSGSMRG